MISKNDILRIVRGALRRKQGVLDTRMVHPKRDWTIGLLVTTVIFITAAVYAFFVFLFISRSIDEPVHVERSVVLYQQERAEEVFEVYRNRTSAFEQLRSERSTISVPGIEEMEVTEETEVTEEAEEAKELSEEVEIAG